MGNKEIILKSLQEEPKTASELAKKLNLHIQDVKTYLLRLKTDNLIKSIDKEGRENVYDLINSKTSNKDISEYKKNLIFLNNFFKVNLNHLMKNKTIVNFIIKNESVFEDIEKLVK